MTHPNHANGTLFIVCESDFRMYPVNDVPKEVIPSYGNLSKMSKATACAAAQASVELQYMVAYASWPHPVVHGNLIWRTYHPKKRQQDTAIAEGSTMMMVSVDGAKCTKENWTDRWGWVVCVAARANYVSFWHLHFCCLEGADGGKPPHSPELRISVPWPRSVRPSVHAAGMRAWLCFAFQDLGPNWLWGNKLRHALFHEAEQGSSWGIKMGASYLYPSIGGHCQHVSTQAGAEPLASLLHLHCALFE